jgi:hypothetical protein
VNGEIESLGLLVEEQRSNSLYYSNDFSQDPLPATAVQGWFKQNSHPVPTQSVVGPDGVSNSGWRFYRTATNQYIFQSVLGAGTHTLSAWVRSSAATGSFTMQGYNSTDKSMATLFTATNEWKRFSITISPTTTTSYYPCIPTNTNEDFYVWGAQLELNKSFETSYIPTSGGTATRNHDRAYYENVDQTEWFNKTEGTVVFEHTDVPYNSSTPVGYPAVGFARTSDGTSASSIQYYFTKNYGAAQYLVRITPGNDSANIDPPGGTGSAAPTSKVGFVYKADDYALVRNGSLVGTDDSGAVPDAYMLIFGMNGVTATEPNWNAHIKHFSYYPTRLSNTVLQNLTK